MPTCELCGKEVKFLRKARVMGAVLNVCDACASYGKEIKDAPKSAVFSRKGHSQFKERMIVEDAAEKIRKALHDRNLEIKTFARAVGIKESTIHKFLSGRISLDLTTADKIGKFLEIRLVDEVNVNEFKSGDNEGDDSGVTLGDLINLK